MAKSNLPAISSQLPPDVRQFLQRVREYMDATPDPVSTDTLVAVKVLVKDSNGKVSKA